VRASPPRQWRSAFHCCSGEADAACVVSVVFVACGGDLLAAWTVTVPVIFGEFGVTTSMENSVSGMPRLGHRAEDARHGEGRRW
jgi:hypothetical protein